MKCAETIIIGNNHYSSFNGVTLVVVTVPCKFGFDVPPKNLPKC